MRAIILAAGKGERLYPLTRNTPKSLLEIGNGITLLENQIMALSKNGVKDIILVVGYKAEQIEAKIRDVGDFNCNIETIYNPFYEISNNLISLWLATPKMDDDFLIINGDNVFVPEVIQKLLNVDNKKEICFLIDRKELYNEEDMKIIIMGNKIIRIGKDIDLKQANGESVGIIRVIGKSKDYLKKELCDMVRIKENMNLFYLSAFQNLIYKGIPIYFFEISPDEWAEVDFHPDLDFIRKNVNIFTKFWNLK